MPGQKLAVSSVSYIAFFKRDRRQDFLLKRKCSFPYNYPFLDGNSNLRFLAFFGGIDRI